MARSNARAVAKVTPNDSGFLPRTDGHSIYFERYGNPKGIPVVLCHGGPGSGSSPSSTEYFDLKKWHLLLFDQRGAGKSRYKDFLRGNKTDKLVEDAIALIDHVGWESAVVFGRSWGSTLALRTADTHPHRVRGLILGSIFLGTRSAARYPVAGPARELYPEAWDRMISLVPESDRSDPFRYYSRQIHGRNQKRSRRYAKEFLAYETATLAISPDWKPQVTAVNERGMRMAMIMTHYEKNKYFMSANALMRGAQKLRMPTHIVHGRFDCICPLRDAIALQSAIRRSKLTIVHAGHAIDAPLHQAMKEAVESIRKELRK